MNHDPVTPKTDDALAKRARQAFNDSVDELDAAALSRLNRSRHAALEAAGARRRPAWSSWLPATGVATAILVSFVVIRGNDAPVVPVGAGQAADLEILLEGDDLEMLQDLEFYSWIELEPESASNVG